MCQIGENGILKRDDLFQGQSGQVAADDSPDRSNAAPDTASAVAALSMLQAAPFDPTEVFISPPCAFLHFPFPYMGETYALEKLSFSLEMSARADISKQYQHQLHMFL